MLLTGSILGDKLRTGLKFTFQPNFSPLPVKRIHPGFLYLVGEVIRMKAAIRKAKKAGLLLKLSE